GDVDSASLVVDNVLLPTGRGISPAGEELPILNQDIQVVVSTNGHLNKRCLVHVVHVRATWRVQRESQVMSRICFDQIPVKAPIVDVPLGIRTTSARDPVT